MDERTFKVVFLGESGTGKTSIITRYIDKAFSGNLAPTVGGACRTLPYKFRDYLLSLTVWDTAGQEIYRSLSPIYYRNSAAAVIVFDITARESFAQVSGWVGEVQAAVENVVTIICGNKLDLDDQRVVPELDGAMLAESLHSVYVEASAKTGQGIDMLFDTLVRETIEQKPDILQRRVDGTVVEKGSRGMCC
jgi:small GTP-binding protein